MTISVVLPAAGSGSRFGGDIPKQLLHLHGKPVLQWSIEAFDAIADEVVVATSTDLIDPCRAIAETITSLSVRVVLGGKHRQASVYAGLQATHPDHQYILVHDAARPLIHPATIDACLHALKEAPACVVAVPCNQTIKRVNESQVTATVPRDDLFLAQTPQGFHRDIGLAAFAQAEQDNFIATDDVAVLAAYGHDAVIVPGTNDNLKVTSPEDAILAAALLSQRRNPA